MSISEELKQYLEYNITSLVDYPDEVNVSVSISTKTIIAQIQVDKSDCGKVIGKKGKTIESLKILTAAVKNTKFSDDNRQIVIEILEDEDVNYNHKV